MLDRTYMQKILKTIQSWFARRTYQTSVVVLVAVIALGIVLPQATNALNPFGAVLLQVLSWIVSGIVFVIGKLITNVIEFIIVVSQYNNFINSTAVTVGWTVLRDLSNMIVIVLLLLIAVGTILKSEHYEYSHMLPRLLTMAVLVNFSKTITGFLIDISQIVMLTFVAAFAEGGPGNFVTALGLEKMLTISPDTVGDVGFLEVFAGIVLALILMIIALIVLLGMLVILSFRIIMLWILTVTSPIVFIASSVEAGHHYYADWWKKLTNYLIVGPALAFFIWLTLVAAGGTPGSDSRLVRDFGGDGKTSYFATAEQQQFITTIGRRENLISFIIAIAMLIGGIHIAGELGVMGAGFMEGMLEKVKEVGEGALHGGAHVVGGVMKAPFKWGIRKWNEQGWYNPKLAWEAFEERRHDLHEKAEHLGMAAAKERVEKFFNRGSTMPYREQAEEHIESEYAGEFTGLSKEQKAKIAKDLWGRSDVEGQRKLRGLFRMAAAEGHMDDIYTSKFFAEEAEWTDEERGPDGKMRKVKRKGFRQVRKDNDGNKVTMKDKDGNDLLNADGSKRYQYVYSNKEILRNYALSALGGGDITKAGSNWQGLSTLRAIGEMGLKIGHSEYYGLTATDAETGHDFITPLHSDPKLYGGRSAIGEALGEVNKQDERLQAKTSPHAVSELVGNDDGTGVRWRKSLDANSAENMTYNATIGGIGKTQPDELERYSQARLVQMLGSLDPKTKTITLEDANDMKDFVAMMNDTPAIARALFARIGGRGVRFGDSTVSIRTDNVQDFIEELNKNEKLLTQYNNGKRLSEPKYPEKGNPRGQQGGGGQQAGGGGGAGGQGGGGSGGQGGGGKGGGGGQPVITAQDLAQALNPALNKMGSDVSKAVKDMGKELGNMKSTLSNLDKTLKSLKGRGGKRGS